MYITLGQLAMIPGAKELADVATPEHLPVVNYELMHARLTGASLSTYADEDVAVAELAIARVNAAINDANGVIDGFLAVRGYLPLQQVPELVSGWCRAITRYKLHVNRLNTDDKDPITRDYNDAMKLLRLTADGKFSLGLDDPTTQASNMPEFTQGRTTFRDAMKDF